MCWNEHCQSFLMCVCINRSSLMANKVKHRNNGSKQMKNWKEKSPATSSVAVCGWTERKSGLSKWNVPALKKLPTARKPAGLFRARQNAQHWIPFCWKHQLDIFSPFFPLSLHSKADYVIFRHIAIPTNRRKPWHALPLTNQCDTELCSSRLWSKLQSIFF